MKKICISIALLLLFAVSFVAFRYFPIGDNRVSRTIDRYVGSGEKRKISILCAGIDNVGNNTDAMIVVTLDIEAKNAYMLQIPRDTYVDKGTNNGKINNLYSSGLSRGMSSNEAIENMKSFISRAFSLPIDYYLVFDLETAKGIIDTIGGVDVYIPFDIEYYDEELGREISLSKGKQLLLGEDALLFVRHRASYLEGDIGRLDAQKIFISSLVGKLKSDLPLSAIISVTKEFLNGSETNIPFDLAVALVMNAFSDTESYKAHYITAPGEAIFDEKTKLWYYVLNREAMSEVLSNYFSPQFNYDLFDEGKIFIKEDNIGFVNIYYAPRVEYEIYSDENITQIDIKTKK